MISRSLISPILKTMSVGEQIKVNHEGCTAGLDTKKRLYIKRVPSGGVAYCHHCNQSGFVRELTADGTKLRKWLFDKPDGDIIRVTRGARMGLQADLVWTNPEHCSPLLWLRRYHIDGQKENGYFQTNGKDLVLPIADAGGRTVGNQIRSFSGGPKYLTNYALGAACDSSWFVVKEIDSRVLVITEDYTSAYRVFRDCNVDSVALLRTSASESLLRTIRYKDYNRIIIWLDPDEAGIKGTSALKTRLRFVVGTHTTIHPVGKGIRVEPKEMDKTALALTIRSLSSTLM